MSPTTPAGPAQPRPASINIDTAAIPDPYVLLACLRKSAAEITALGSVGPAAGLTFEAFRDRYGYLAED